MCIKCISGFSNYLCEEAGFLFYLVCLFIFKEENPGQLTGVHSAHLRVKEELSLFQNTTVLDSLNLIQMY